jgi:hypothetical protein
MGAAIRSSPRHATRHAGPHRAVRKLKWWESGQAQLIEVCEGQPAIQELAAVGSPLAEVRRRLLCHAWRCSERTQIPVDANTTSCVCRPRWKRRLCSLKVRFGTGRNTCNSVCGINSPSPSGCRPPACFCPVSGSSFTIPDAGTSASATVHRSPTMPWANLRCDDNVRIEMAIFF